MEVKIEPGRYIVAVSGGVDSVVLLDLLARNKNLDLIVAHFDHGIRDNSADDQVFVQELAKKYGLKYESERQELGINASEELARSKRYEFLNKIKDKYQAKKIITAHHADDYLETAIFNLLRGTGRRGLSSLKSGDILRPLLNYKKSQILEYAKRNNLAWQEDETNEDTKYSRNKIRQMLKDKTAEEKHSLGTSLEKMSDLNQRIDDLLVELFYQNYDESDGSMKRSFFISMDHKISCELLMFWLRSLGCQFDKKLINKLATDLKTLKNNKSTDIDKDYYFEINEGKIRIKQR